MEHQVATIRRFMCAKCSTNLATVLCPHCSKGLCPACESEYVESNLASALGGRCNDGETLYVQAEDKQLDFNASSVNPIIIPKTHACMGMQISMFIYAQTINHATTATTTAATATTTAATANSDGTTLDATSSIMSDDDDDVDTTTTNTFNALEEDKKNHLEELCIANFNPLFVTCPFCFGHIFARMTKLKIVMTNSDENANIEKFGPDFYSIIDDALTIPFLDEESSANVWMH